MCKRVYLTAKEAEKEMQEARKADGFTGKMETGYISRMIKDAKRNSMVGDKLHLYRFLFIFNDSHHRHL